MAEDQSLLRVAGAPQSGMDRRRRSDERHRESGRVRLHAWIGAQRLADLDALVEHWGFADRAEAVDAAIRFLRKQSGSLSRLEL